MQLKIWRSTKLISTSTSVNMYSFWYKYGFGWDIPNANAELYLNYSIGRMSNQKHSQMQMCTQCVAMVEWPFPFNHYTLALCCCENRFRFFLYIFFFNLFSSFHCLLIRFKSVERTIYDHTKHKKQNYKCEMWPLTKLCTIHTRQETEY